MAGGAHKYTDRDLRSEPELIAEAIEYAKHYEGSFDYVIDAYNLWRDTGTLPLGVARGVLNAKRTDPRAAFEAPPVPPRPRLKVVRAAPPKWTPRLGRH